MIGDHVDDDISLAGWYVANGFAGTFDMIEYFIRAEAASNNAMLGDNDAINVAHTHTTPTRSNHIHGIGGVQHQHTLPSSGSVWRTGTNYNWLLAGNAWTGGAWYSSSSGIHDHIDFGDAEPNHTHLVTGGASGGVDGADKNIPAYYSVIVIQKVS